MFFPRETFLGALFSDISPLFESFGIDGEGSIFESESLFCEGDFLFSEGGTV